MTERMIPFPIQQTTVEAGTGRVISEQTVQAGLILPPVKAGQCEICHTAHDAALPHNPHSLPYQYRVYAELGRWPDWRDAMAHCDPEVREAWTAELVRMGIDVEGGKITPEKAAT